MGIPAGTARSARSSSRFVSRIRERQLLSGWLDEVAAGEARIVLMTGPLGVGKSALVRWTVGRARQLGFATLVGSGQEDLDVPYLAVASVLSPPPAVSLDDDAPVVGWGPEADPQARSRLQLFLEASDRLTALARQRPTLVVLDDLHWADPSSLDFVAHLTGLAGAGHVLPVGFVLATRTDVGGERVRRLLARLEREPCVRRMAVAAMNEAELNELLASVAGARPDASVSRAVMESSRGIPFAALEVLRSMMDHADVVVIDGHLVARADMPVLATDAGVDDLLRLRLEKIGDDCRRLLVTAAVIGDDRSMHELARLAREDLSDVLELMEEAEEAGLVEIADDLYRFAHPYLRTRVQASVGTLRLQAIHLSVADALEGDPPSPELALRIAAHLERAAARCPADRLEKAARAALVAASAIGGWSHVVHSANLVLASANDLSSSQRCALHLSAAQAAFRDADVRVAAEHFALVIELATPGEDDDAWATAIVGLARVELTRPDTLTQLRHSEASIDALLADVGTRRPDAWARALALRAELAFAHFDGRSGLDLAARARAAAATADDHATTVAVSFAEGLQRLAQLELDRAADLFAASIAAAERLGDRFSMAWGVGRLPLVHLAAGELDQAVRTAHRAVELTEAEHNWGEGALACGTQAVIAVAQGRFLDAIAQAETALSMSRRAEFSYPALMVLPAVALAHGALGDAAAAHLALDELDEILGTTGTRYRVLTDLERGDVEAAEKWMTRATWRSGLSEPPTIATLSAAVAALEIGVALGDPSLMDLGEAHVEAALRCGWRSCLDWPSSLRRAVGAGLLARGELDRAVSVLEQAEQEALATGSTWMVARARFDLAAALAVRRRPDDVARAAALLSEAIERFVDLGALRMAARGNERAHDLDLVLPGDEPDRMLRTILVTDIVGSTATNYRIGDETYFEVLRAQDRITRLRLREHGGVELKHTGDGLYAWFHDVPAAARCALAIQQDIERWHQERPSLSVRLRCGLTVGRPVADGTQLFGVAMAEAARICATAEPGGIMVSAEARDLTGHLADVRFDLAGEFDLKGLPAPSRLFVVRPA